MFVMTALLNYLIHSWLPFLAGASNDDRAGVGDKEGGVILAKNDHPPLLPN